MEKNLCRPGFALPLLMALLFAAAPAHAQELGIETVPSQPRALQEFEVWYTAGGEIESIEMPCWGSLTLVRELGRTSGTQTSVRDGVMTRSETHAYRYLVRSAVGGELVIPGTTAVVGGQKLSSMSVRSHSLLYCLRMMVELSARVTLSICACTIFI